MFRGTNMSVSTCTDKALLPFGGFPFPPGWDCPLALHTAMRTAGAGQSPGTRLVSYWTPLPLMWVRVPGKPGCPGHSGSRHRAQG